jgi:hypothetical protein
VDLNGLIRNFLLKTTTRRMMRVIKGSFTTVRSLCRARTTEKKAAVRPVTVNGNNQQVGQQAVEKAASAASVRPPAAQPVSTR